MTRQDKHSELCDQKTESRPLMTPMLGEDTIIQQAKLADDQTYTKPHTELSPNSKNRSSAGREPSQIFHSSEFVEEHKGSDRVVPSQFAASLTENYNNSATSLLFKEDNKKATTTTRANRDNGSASIQGNQSIGLDLTAIFECHDSFSRFTSGGGSDIPRLGNIPPERNGEKTSEETSHVASAIQHNLLGTTSLSTPQGLTMGLNNNTADNEALSQQRRVSQQEKMEENEQATSIITAGDYLRTNERKDHEDDSTTAHSIDSSVPSPALSPREPVHAEANALGTLSVATTPSTVSTAPSTTDEASLILDPTNLDRLALRMEGSGGVGLTHRRAPSWEAHTLPLPASSDPTLEPGLFMGASSQTNLSLVSPNMNVWNHPQAHARIASFRNEAESHRFGLRPPEPAWHQQQHPNPQQQPSGGQTAPSQMYRQQPSPFPYQNPSTTPRPHSSLPPTPPRGPPRGIPPTRVQPSPHRASGTGPGSRSSAEVLKTLLRKKACLYEPDTSRAVALVTWLVGRELALEFGFFSRQQLQAGVHTCVSDKIDSGVITRTKVNRCMQIILNSCFHYIIPRPDGSEENGEVFRLMFAREVTDDTLLLRELPAPWHDLSVSSDAVLTAALQEGKSPPDSPVLESRGNPGKDSSNTQEDQDSENKRAVLLCFNENVRCAEDVFRCHNEFIRDTAHACHLQLSSYEWRHFFGPEAAGGPHLWGNIGIPVPSNEMCDPGQVDALGMLAMNELTKFRTFWCTKRYEHDHELCGFAHIEVNGGWLRRNPSHHNYRAEMCQFVTRQPNTPPGSKSLIINECPHGMNCEFAHSSEEVFFHPMRYKRRICHAIQRHPGICHHGDACPDFHPMDSYRFPSKKIDGRAGSRHSRHTGAAKGATPPIGAPILYASPAPPSRFEDHLVLPGLKNLYRRNCSVTRANIRQGGQCVCFYSNFGDDTGVAANAPGAQRVKPRGLPPVPR